MFDLNKKSLTLIELAYIPSIKLRRNSLTLDNKIFDRMLVEELSSNKYPISHAISLIKVCKKVKKHIKAIFYLLLKMCPR